MTHAPVASLLADVVASLDTAEPGWEPMAALGAVGLTRSFVSGEPDGERLRVRYYRRVTDESLIARVWFGPGAEGPPGHVHGGAMAAVLDEAMGASAWLAGHAVVAAKITIQFRAMLPIGSIVTVEAGVANVDGRKVTTRGRLFGADGVTRAEGEGLFIELGAARIATLVTRSDDRGPS